MVGLVNSDTVDPHHPDQHRCGRHGDRRRQPVRHRPERRRRHRSRQLRHRLPERQPRRSTPRTLTITASQQDQDLRRHGHLRPDHPIDRLLRRRPGQQRHGHQHHPDQRRRGRHGDRRRQPVRDRPERRRRHRPRQLRHRLPERQPDGRRQDLTITAANKTKTYGDTVTFDETTPSTDFSVGRPGQQRHRHQHHPDQCRRGRHGRVSGSPYAIVPSAAVGTGLGNYDIGYQNGSLTVNAKTLTITAANKTKTYGDTVTFDQTTPSTDFSVVGLVNSDTVTSITLTSAGAAATARSAAVRTRSSRARRSAPASATTTSATRTAA